MGGADRDLTAYYAENRRRSELAGQEFTSRAHGWRFALSADAATWAADRPDPVQPADLVGLVRDADAAGLFLTPEPGTIRSAFSTRDSCTEETTGEGFGFWPATAEHLVVHAGSAVGYDELPGLDVLGVLQRVVDTFAVPRASFEQA